MRLQHKNSGLSSSDSMDDLYMENTNPFQRSSSFQNDEKSSRPGKRPRIMKPFYSVRLS